MYEYAGITLKVVDADTINVAVDLGFDITRNMAFRLLGIDAPELSTPEGKLARTVVATAKLPIGTPVTLRTVKDRREKYGRYLADVYLSDGEHLNQWLLDNNYAVPYSGGTR